ncbi:hypothetical protein CLOP_g22936 [Closterium sp. NIES-67]|nr:hypothetical protein CLOP_g22936 [Closterium sp. NIES-67]
MKVDKLQKETKELQEQLGAAKDEVETWKKDGVLKEVLEAKEREVEALRREMEEGKRQASGLRSGRSRRRARLRLMWRWEAANEEHGPQEQGGEAAAAGARAEGAAGGLGKAGAGGEGVVLAVGAGRRKGEGR